MKQVSRDGEIEKSHEITRGEAFWGLFCAIIWFSGWIISCFLGYSIREQIMAACVSFFVAVLSMVIGIGWMMRKEKL